MTYKGTVSNGVVVLPPEANLPDGTEVRVEPVNGDSQPASIGKKLTPLDGSIKDLPEDFAENHDHYLHGSPKR
ncbi:MAG TPA: hypothetical protein VG028_19880 [Terriglobia bacterium]|nr:hypothetical protein [Terriglobia bacterium]